MRGLKQRKKVSCGHAVFFIASTYMSKIYLGGMIMDLLVLNLVGGLIALLIGGVLYYRNPEQKFYLLLIVIGVLDIVIAGIRMLLT
ncbi:hypothetical protein [Bacillus sp. 71mf]|nr:hypothetical protein [Bacillus sp. 71mf]SFJ28221.1 hypothetical protein SAMN04488574_10991 [Bacillus sp. 71mf]SFS54329.1 hypothetical protein SAMN04488145_1011135 [Bacillus sp. 103mf]